jgi:hypothetical protein
LVGLEFEFKAFCTCKAGALMLEPYLQFHHSSGNFGDGVLRTICPGWPRIEILWISAF